MYEEQNKQMY